MSDTNIPGRMSRRALLFGGAGAATIVAISSRTGPAEADVPAVSLRGAQLASTLNQAPDVHLVATDGWVNIARPALDAAGAADLSKPWMKDISPFWPDPLGSSHNDGNLYVFGFRNATGLTPAQVTGLRGQAQISAPQLAFEEIGQNEQRDKGYRVKLSNLGLAVRPDLVDGHTIHWHGFVNAIPLFDGVPELSLSVPIGRDFTYFYRPYDAGTYMYHCHFEDVEHVQMGMTGLLFVSPLQNRGLKNGPVDATHPDGLWPAAVPAGKYVYNDGDGSTRYDREFGMMLTEIFAEGHYRDAHIQTTDWTDFKASFWCLNGRTYPDTVAPNGEFQAQRGYSPFDTAKTNPADTLLYQPQSSLVSSNAGERILLRLANLGYQNHAMTVDSIDLTIVGKDASLLKNGGNQQYVTTNTVDIGPGESRDVLFTAPSFDPAAAAAAGTPYNAYLLYDRDLAYASNAGQPGAPGGMQTEIRVYPTGTLAAQTHPNA